MTASVMGRVRTALFGIAPAEASLVRRGFAATTAEKQRRLEASGEAFIAGYLAALDCGHPQRVASNCETLPEALRGFAYEGAAMGLSVIDLVTTAVPNRFRAFVEGPGERHVYMAHVGAGWALARCPWGLMTFAPRLDPLLKWLAFDGLGFHEAFFAPAKFIERRETCWKRTRAPQAFDNGLGRALWFACGANAANVIRSIASFPADRRAAIWSGVGLAVSYAGGASEKEITDLLTAAGSHRSELLSGAAFAAKARLRAGNPTPELAVACRAICGVDEHTAAAVTDHALAGLSLPYGVDAYRRWRESITSMLTMQRGVPPPAKPLLDPHERVLSR